MENSKKNYSIANRIYHIEIVHKGRTWAFDADGHHFKLTIEALRIRLAYLFEPLLAVTSSDIEALPYKISAVYEKMLSKQPLRYLLANDPTFFTYDSPSTWRRFKPGGTVGLKKNGRWGMTQLM